MKSIDPVQFETFKKTLPGEIQDECFCWLNTRFDISKALFIIKIKALTVNNINVKSWAKAFGMDTELNLNPMSFNMLTGVNDVDALKENINPEIPIIIAEHAWKNKRKKEITTLVIDGNKRLRKAFIQNQENINAYYITQDLIPLIHC